jgi:hypothetical protein
VLLKDRCLLLAACCRGALKHRCLRVPTSAHAADVLSRRPESPPAGISAESWARTTAAAQAKWRTSTRLTPTPLMSPDYVVSTVLSALRHNDDPYPDHGCEVAIRFR